MAYDSASVSSDTYYDDGGYGDDMDKTAADTENDTDTADGSTAEETEKSDAADVPAEEPMERSADAGDTADPADANGVIITG